MRQRVAAFLIMFWLVASVARGDDSGGFRGIRWGTSLADLAGMELTKIVDSRSDSRSNPRELENYRRRSEELKVGGATVDSISYNFLQGKFYGVTIDFKGFGNYEKLTAYCRELLGPSTRSMGRESELYVAFDTPRSAALLYYQFSRQVEQRYEVRFGRLFLYSRELDRQLAN